MLSLLLHIIMIIVMSLVTHVACFQGEVAEGAEPRGRGAVPHGGRGLHLLGQVSCERKQVACIQSLSHYS